MKEFNVRVESTNNFRIVPREEAIKEAKRQIKSMLEQGYRLPFIFVNFYHEETKEHLGSVKLINKEDIELVDVDMRICTIKALLN